MSKMVLISALVNAEWSAFCSSRLIPDKTAPDIWDHLNRNLQIVPEPILKS